MPRGGIGFLIENPRRGGGGSRRGMGRGPGGCLRRIGEFFLGGGGGFNIFFRAETSTKISLCCDLEERTVSQIEHNHSSELQTPIFLGAGWVSPAIWALQLHLEIPKMTILTNMCFQGGAQEVEGIGEIAPNMFGGGLSGTKTLRFIKP